MPILTQLQIQNLYNRYKNVVNYINEQSNEQVNGQKIKQVQLPSSMTQSMAYNYIINNPNSIGLENILEENLREGNSRTYDLIYQIGTTIINI